MKKLSVQLTFLIIFGLVSILVMEFVLGDKQSEMAFQRKCFEDQKAETETLIVGHCEGHSNINPYFFSKKTFNFSHFDQGAYYTEKMVEKYMGANTPKLANIVVNVNPFSFSARHVPSSLFLKESFMHLDIFPDLYRDGLKFLSGFSLYYQELENLLASRFSNLDLKYEILSKEKFTEKDIDKKSEKPIAYCNGFKGYFGSYPVEKVNDFYKEFIEYFDYENPEHHHYRKIVQRLSGSNYNVYFVLGPRMKSYLSLLAEKQPDLMDKFYKSMDKLVKEHTFVHFLDFSKSERFDNEHFSEPNVLNVRGSAKFSKYLDYLLNLKDYEVRFLNSTYIDSRLSDMKKNHDPKADYSKVTK